MAMYAQLPATPATSPTTTVPVVSPVPSGWSVGPTGGPISPTGTQYPPGTSFDPAGNPIAPTGSSIPVASIGVMAIAGYILGQPRGQERLWAGVGAILGYAFHPLENP